MHMLKIFSEWKNFYCNGIFWFNSSVSVYFSFFGCDPEECDDDTKQDKKYAKGIESLSPSEKQ